MLPGDVCLHIANPQETRSSLRISTRLQHLSLERQDGSAGCTSGRALAEECRQRGGDQAGGGQGCRSRKSCVEYYANNAARAKECAVVAAVQLALQRNRCLGIKLGGQKIEKRSDFWKAYQDIKTVLGWGKETDSTGLEQLTRYRCSKVAPTFQAR